MKGKLRALSGALLVVTLAACSHKASDTPLSYVPDNTPYLIANLKPMPADVRAAIYKQADQQLQMQVDQIRMGTEKLKAKDPKLAALLNVFADEFDGRTLEQGIQHMGLDPDGLSALYGLGMSPVMRFQLSDPKAYEGFVARIEKALGASLTQGTLDKVTYRYADFGDKAKLRFLSSVQDKKAVLALLPADASPDMMRMALGLKHPDKSVQDTDRVEKLADAKGYKPYSVSYIDFRQWPALIAGEKDPMVKALLANAPEAAAKLPASCEADFARMAARVPMVSFGLTTVEPKHIGYRVNIALASDIAKTFAGIDIGLPGMDSKNAAPLDVTFGMPVKEFRSFWMAQADAVAAKPFTCPALVKLNEGFGKLRMAVQKTAVPPINDLRGLRLMIDRLEIPAAGSSSKIPDVAGRVLIASDNPEGMLAMAQMGVPALSTMKLDKNGKPVALPADLTKMAGSTPAWAAMTDHLLGLAVGTGEEQRLADDMKASAGSTGTLLAFRMDGSMYRKWIDLMADKATASMQGAIANSDDPEAAAQAKQTAKQMQQMKDQAKRIDNVIETFHADDDGVTVDADVWHH
ncbi:hypothetical protein [Oleiagrimonas soli]|uniref:Uncharacterized protein n=1 Tax=Oleiagrimonas soli TaxID=1543381 RepID=A0A099D036_9GAMM|nr:hypothetical protein [Oleiagrimonas soli]KGI78620.1 hypothetical protein LF63_0104015 [Oleiagrimonas soli]MBB6184083.1 hypothetical protein [Oleiagrimonas soli]